MSASASSAPPSLKSRSSLSISFRCAGVEARDTSGASRSARYFAYRRRSCARSRVERDDLRQVLVVRVAQLRRVDDGVEVAHGAPGTVEMIERHRRPARPRRAQDGVRRGGGHRFDRRRGRRRAARRRRASRAQGRIASKRGQAGKIEQRIVVRLHVLRASFVGRVSGSAWRLVGGRALDRGPQARRAFPRWPRGHRSARRKRGRARSSRATAEEI